jgi:ComF family protein
MMTALAETFLDRLDVSLAFFYPETCQICQTERATAKDGFVCWHCRSQVHFIKSPFCERCGLPYPGDITTPFECTNCREMELHFTSARSAVVAHNIVREAVHRYKYQRALWFEPFLADLFLREAVPALRGQDWDFIVPVPLHSVKQREREFNQAERLAAHLNAATQIPLNLKLLWRVRSTATQTLLTRQQRAANMRGAFALRPGVGLNGERVVLVDDVFTTGATTNACAQVLRAAGAGDVCVWTVARGL